MNYQAGRRGDSSEAMRELRLRDSRNVSALAGKNQPGVERPADCEDSS
jgi:hypothetical protein